MILRRVRWYQSRAWYFVSWFLSEIYGKHVVPKLVRPSFVWPRMKIAGDLMGEGIFIV